MSMDILIVNSVLGFIQIIFAYVIYRSDEKSVSNRLFALFLIITSVWLIAIGLLTTDIGGQIWFSRTIFGLGITMAFIFMICIESLSMNLKSVYRKSPHVWWLIAYVLVTILVYGPFVILDVQQVADPKTLPVPIYGWGILFYFALLISIVLATIRILVINMRNDRIGLHSIKTESQYMVWAFVIAAIILTMTNLVLPSVLGNTYTAQFGGFAVLMFNFVLGYAVFRAQIFSVKIPVIRATTYFFTILILLVIYVLFIGSIGNLFFGNNNADTSFIIGAFSALVAALTFHPLKKRFDKISDQLFLRDDYNSSDFIRTLNEKLVSFEKLEDILTASSETINQYLKPNFSTVVLDPSINSGLDNSYYAKDFTLNLIEIERLFIYMRQQKDAIVITRTVESDRQTRKFFRANDIGMVSEIRAKDQLIGLLIISNRQSGTGYTMRDIKAIKTASNALAIASQNSLRFIEIEQFNLKLQHDIKIATRKLRQSNNKLVFLDNQKDEFISMTSHQLRTPLTVIKGSLSVALDDGELKGSSKTMVQNAFNSSKRMGDVVADLLNASRIKNGKFNINIEDCQLDDIIKEELKGLKNMTHERNIKLSYVQYPDDFPVIQADPNKLRQVIMNFIDNAIYYTDKGGKLKIILKANNNEVEFTVEDSGIGVNTDDQNELFTKYFRAKNAKIMRPDGTGIGLFVAKTIIQTHGGSIIFSSIPGKGSTFGFRIPLKVK